MLMLPDDLLSHIFMFLKDEEIVSKCTMVSCRFNLISNNQRVWSIRNTVDRYQFKRIWQGHDDAQQGESNGDDAQQEADRVHRVIHRPSGLETNIIIHPRSFIGCESVDRLYQHNCVIIVNQYEIICIGRNPNKQKKEEKKTVVDVDYLLGAVKYILRETDFPIPVQVRIFMYICGYMKECFTIEEKEEDDKSTKNGKQNIDIHINCIIWCIFIILKTIPFNALEGLMRVQATRFKVDKLMDKHWKSIGYVLTHPIDVIRDE